MARDQDGRTKGFAHIEFTDQEGVARAISYTNTDLKGRQIRVEYSKETSVRGRGAARPPGGWEQI
jgi:RNA recognition motif-containing protein